MKGDGWWMAQHHGVDTGVFRGGALLERGQHLVVEPADADVGHDVNLDLATGRRDTTLDGPRATRNFKGGWNAGVRIDDGRGVGRRFGIGVDSGPLSAGEPGHRGRSEGSSTGVCADDQGRSGRFDPPAKPLTQPLPSAPGAGLGVAVGAPRPVRPVADGNPGLAPADGRLSVGRQRRRSARSASPWRPPLRTACRRPPNG